jgi:hypothetical protein
MASSHPLLICERSIPAIGAITAMGPLPLCTAGSPSRPDRVPIGIQTLAGPETIIRQRHPFPLGQREQALRLRVSVVLDVEGRLRFHAVEVVIDPRALLQKQRGRDSLQIQGRRQVVLEVVLDEFDCSLRLLQSQCGPITRVQNQIRHWNLHITPWRVSAPSNNGGPRPYLNPPGRSKQERPGTPAGARDGRHLVLALW